MREGDYVVTTLSNVNPSKVPLKCFKEYLANATFRLAFLIET